MFLKIEYKKDGYRFHLTEQQTDIPFSSNSSNFTEEEKRDIARLIETGEPAVSISSETHQAWFYSGIAGKSGYLDHLLKPLAEKWFAKVGALRWIHRMTPVEDELSRKGFSKIQNHRSGLTIWKASTEYDNTLVAVHQGQVIKKGCWEIYGNQYVSAYEEFYDDLLGQGLLDDSNSANSREKRKEWEEKQLAKR